ncbi:MAG: two pore domain potassium channel family protein [Bacteroidia bacterium]|nr:MAG: two pore domain potassium channel family protein [Bacteroidia bacterium]
MGKFAAKKHMDLIRSGPGRQKSLLKTNIVLLIALSVLIFLMPVIPLDIPLLSRILLGLVVVSGLFAADFSSSMFRILLSFATVVIGVTVLGLFLSESDSLAYLTFSLNTIFFVLITIALITHVAGSTNVSSSTLLCAVNSYLLIGLSLSMLFIILDLTVPDSFNLAGDEANIFSTFLYYGFVTLTTLGYGDILPLTPLARSLATFTALFGQLYLVIIMAFLIGKYLNAKNQAS